MQPILLLLGHLFYASSYIVFFVIIGLFETSNVFKKVYCKIENIISYYSIL